MKKLLFFLFSCCIMVSYSQDKVPKISLFLNLGQSIPIGSYRASDHPSGPVAIACTRQFGTSFNLGCDYYFHPRLGVSAGISGSVFDLDETAFEKFHSNDIQYSDSYLRHHNCERFYAGASTRWIFNKVNVAVRFNVGYSSFNFEYADYYQANATGEIYETISYNFGQSECLSLNTGFNANWQIIKLGNLKFRLQLFSEISYQSPEIKYEKTESNKYKETHSVTEESYKQNIWFLYYGVGFVIPLYSATYRNGQAK